KRSPIPAGEALARIERVLDCVDADRAGVDDHTRLDWVRAARRVRGRIEALAGLLVAEADQAQASERAAGTPMTSWLGMGENLSKREAAGAVGQARSLGEHPRVGEAATEGRIGTGQARAITRVLDGLSDQLDAAQQARAEQVLVELASHLDADQLSRSAGRVLAQVAPTEADELSEQRLQRQAETAYRQRSLRFYRDGASVRFDGSLPRVEAEQWIALIDTHQEALRRTTIEARDPLAVPPNPEQRRADALISLINTAANAIPVPGLGVPTVIVTLDYHQLHQQAAGAGLIGDGVELSAGELRRVCCEANLVPAVLGGPSEVLDVGREHRLVTKPIRTALIQRDGGCTFPGCDTRPNLCEAHHIISWWNGGPTALHNLTLLCHHHHALIEPARYTTRDQWTVRITDDGYPEYTPPARYDPQQKPIRHRRHARPDTASPPATDQGTGPPTAA
ncbi:MAG: DUF222 domain-containing protein, partial [Propionibacteriaceae bacterium]|nr:DUF222 domain-containing protein [Propionibacteriaceae bacterium]